MDYAKDAAEHRTSYTYDPNNGRLLTVGNANNKFTRHAYTDRGEAWRIWGDVPQAVEIEYDQYGQRDTLKSFRGGVGRAAGDVLFVRLLISQLKRTIRWRRGASRSDRG